MRQDYSHEQPCLRLVSNMIRSIKLIGYSYIVSPLCKNQELHISLLYLPSG